MPLDDLAQQTHALLKRIQQRGDFFDTVNALRPQLKRVFGEDKPLEPNRRPDGTDNPEGRAKNRRVALLIENPTNARKPGT